MIREPLVIEEAPQGAQWEELLKQELCVLRGVAFRQWGLDNSLFSIQRLKERHGDFPVKVLVQDASELAFSVKTAYKLDSCISEFVKTMREPVKSRKRVPFVVNVDIRDWTAEMNELRRALPEEVLWGSDKDSLKYTRQQYVGVTTPQIYMKVKGCWTGGHEENLRLAAANLNHGPAGSEWWGLSYEQAPRFRELVKCEHGIDIYLKETLWWPSEEFCLGHGFELLKVVQQPGDLVLVGPGTIHWVRSLGAAVNTAWNFGPKFKEHFVRSFARDAVNGAIRFPSIVPLNTLSLDILNNEMCTLPADLSEYLFGKIKEKFLEENRKIKGYMCNLPVVNPHDNVLHCEECEIEILRVYVRCETCYLQRELGAEYGCFFCLECAGNHGCQPSQMKLVQKFTVEAFAAVGNKFNEFRNRGTVSESVRELLWTDPRQEPIPKRRRTGEETDSPMKKVKITAQEEANS